MTTSIRTSSDDLSSIIAINGVDKLTIDSNGKTTATKFSGDGSELTGLIKSGIASGIVSPSTGVFIQSVFTGIVILTGAPDRLRLTTVNGTDTFDAGSINILYEG